MKKKIEDSKNFEKKISISDIFEKKNDNDENKKKTVLKFFIIKKFKAQYDKLTIFEQKTYNQKDMNLQKML